MRSDSAFLRTATLSPVQSPEILADWGVEHLTALVAVDSQSDENSSEIPSSEGQRKLSTFVAAFFDRIGLRTETDNFANLVVHIPARLPQGRAAPTIALMAHLDTVRGTQAVSELSVTPAWEGTEVLYPGNEQLVVTVDDFAATEPFLRQDLLHGPGTAPFGLDNKLGIAQLMTMARVLLTNPEVTHGALLLVFRPDEEIARMAAVDGLAETLAEQEVSYGYTVDGIEPFEVNVENFNATRARVAIAGRPTAPPAADCARRIEVRLAGVKSHGATAKAEGYRNATVILARAMAALGDRTDITPIDFHSDAASEVNASVTFVLSAQDDGGLDTAEGDLLAALRGQVAPHRARGAEVAVTERGPVPVDAAITDEARRLTSHLQAFLEAPGVEPLLSEESEGREGYSNPFFVARSSDHSLELSYRLRSFDRADLEARASHLRAVCESDLAGPLPCVFEPQYVNMGPELANHPNLVGWAQDAAKAMGAKAALRPIRGGTGVDPFLERGIPVANLGAGYFAPESEKEFTSRQMLAQHIVWLTHLVQMVAGG